MRLVPKKPVLVAAVSVLVLVGITFVNSSCAGGRQDRRDVSSSRTSGTITISAAASLTEAFGEVISAFESEHVNTKVVANYGSSGKLAEQIRSGAPVDVAAFADTVPMDSLESEGLLGSEQVVFARNELVIVTKPGNPDGIRSLDDLANLSTGVVSLCESASPCGKFADQMLGSAGVTLDPSRVTRGEDAKATLAAVSEGDAAAGIVYVTDARAARGKVESIEIPKKDNAMAFYPIAVLKDSSSRGLADSFIKFVTGVNGQRILRRHGFLSNGN